MKHIAIFASGSGTNAEHIIRHFKSSPHIRVAAVYCNKAGAGVIDRAKEAGVLCRVFGKKDFYETGAIVQELKDLRIDLVVLAGFLWLVPRQMIDTFPRRIVNIHPALLPGAGGKGMYGMRVHESVLAGGAARSGITIHYVNEHFDEGEIIFTASCEVDPGESPESLASKIHALEYKHYPDVIEKLLLAS